jgi:hypothetical protein
MSPDIIIHPPLILRGGGEGLRRKKEGADKKTHQIN